MLDLSISIVNTSNWKYLEPCLRAIINNVYNIHYEILVVDNASEDGSSEKIKELFPGVILTVNTQRYGFAKNNNINLRKSSGRYLMLLNDDTLVHAGSLDIAVKYLDNNPEVGIVGCKMINPDGAFQPSSARRFRTLLSTLLSESGIVRNIGFVEVTDLNHAKEIDLPQEAGMILRREVVNEVGILDERFFMFGEGADWCRRIKRAGWKIVYLPDCPIIHFGGVTNKRSSLRMFLQSYKSTYLYFKKENIFVSEVYRLIIVLIYITKYFLSAMKYTIRTEKDKDTEILEYYKALVIFMLFQLHDPTYPYPIN